MKFKRGAENPRHTNPASGRKPGTPNRWTALREQILGALDELGGQEWLVRLGRTEPRAFAGLLSRLLPTRLAGAEGDAIAVDIGKAAAELRGLSDEELLELREIIGRLGVAAGQDEAAPLH